MLLKLGVNRVQKVKSAQGVSSRSPHAEIDLLFVWDGRLWLVDCKDQNPVEHLVERLRQRLLQHRDSEAETLLNQIVDRLFIGPTKVLKQDLLAAREAGGLLGNVICVRKTALSDEVREYARRNSIEVVNEQDMARDLRDLLFPKAPPTKEQLEALARALSSR